MNEILYSACIQLEAAQSAEHRDYFSKACYHSNSNSVSAQLPLRRIKLFFHSKKIRLMCQVLTHSGFSGMETAPTSIEVILCPNLGQSDEPSDSRGSTAPGNPRQTPIHSWTEPSVAQLQ